MKQIIILVLGLFIGFSLNAQDVAIKKKVVTIDGVEELKLDGPSLKIEGSTAMVKSVKSGDILFTIHLVYHDGYYNVDVSFLDFDEEMRIKVINYKKLFADMYELGVINEEGKVVEENAKKYSRLYNKHKPTKIIISD